MEYITLFRTTGDTYITVRSSSTNRYIIQQFNPTPFITTGYLI
jgi:hypothetical protein